MADDPRECGDGPVSGVRSGAGRAVYRHRPEGDYPSPQVLQDEQLLCGHPALRLLQVERVQTVAAG